MKLIATIFLFLFILAQAAPSIISFLTDSSFVFIVDEEKNGEKPEFEKKEKKEYPPLYVLSTEFSHRINTAFHLAEKIYPNPTLEKLTPPPNFC